MSIIPITGDTEATGPLGPRDVLIPISGTVTPDRDSDRVQAPGHASDTVVHGPACRPLVGEDYPPRWCICEEAAWQQLAAEVDTDITENALTEYRDALARSQSLLADP